MPPGLLLPALALILAALVILAAKAVLREFQAPGPPGAAPQPAPETEREPLAETMRRLASQLSMLLGSPRHIETVPLLVVLGADTAAVRRLIPDLGRPEFAAAFPRGEIDIAFGPDGAVASFPDGLLGSEGWERRWSSFLHAIARLRRDQSFDQLVITLPATSLAGPSRLSDDALAATGSQLYQMIWTAQRASGWRVPVSLILTGCETLTGFSATAARLPHASRTPLGWAVPYGLDTAFERRWATEGVEALVGKLSAVQAQLLMQPMGTEEAEQLLLLPQAVAALAPPLAVLLASALRQSAYHQPFMFRGFYLTGEAQGAPAFNETLFRDRIVPEHVLAQPAEGANTWRRRRIRLAQFSLAAFVLLGLFGLSRVSANRNDIDSVRRLVSAIGAVDARSLPAPAPGSQPAHGAETDALLQLMANVSINRLETPWAPLSYLGNATLDVERAIKASFETVVLRAVHFRLTRAIPTLLGAPDPLPAATACTAGAAGPQDIARMRALLPRLQAYANALLAYQALPDHPRIETLAPLLEFTLGLQLPPGFTSNYNLYESGLGGAIAPPLQIATIRAITTPLVSAMGTEAIDAFYPGSALARAVTDAASAGAATPPEDPVSSLQALDADLHEVAADAPLPAYAWAAGKAPSSLPSSFTAPLDRLASGNALSPIDPALPPALQAEAANCAAQTQKQLAAARLFGSPILAFTPQGAALSPALAPVHKALDQFLALPLASASLPQRPLPAPGTPLLWNTQALLPVQQMAETYLTFRTQNLPATLPPAFTQSIQAAAGARLEGLAGGAVFTAEQAGATSGPATGSTALREQVTQFAAAAPILTSLRTALAQSGEAGAAARLDAILFTQAITLLGEVDSLLTGADPYQLADPSLSFWSGAPPLAAPAFGAASLPELVGTLPARRDYVQALSDDYAAPLLSYLTQSKVIASGSAAVLIDRWKAIAATLARYHHGDPTNALSQLEQFISADMDRIDQGNCQQIAGTPAYGSNWFATTLQTIRRAVLTRCASVRYQDTASTYSALAAAFDQSLAGRFPFGPFAAPDADPGDVKRFFTRFGPGLAALQSQLAASRGYTAEAAAAFIGQLRQVQSALSPMLDNPAPDAPLSYEVGVDFRTNPGSDPGASQIAEARLSFGDRSLSWFAAQKSLAWTSGQAVAVTLRWADDAPSEPAARPGSPATISGRSAGFASSGPWSLLRLIAAHTPAPATLAQLSDRRPETIEFQVPLQPNPQAAPGGVTGLSTADLFMRLTLTAIIQPPGQPARKQAVTLPAFPAAAPRSW